MARVLIVEPHADLRTLLDLVIRRLGHEPVIPGVGDGHPVDLDAGVIEVGDGAGLLAARRLREQGRPVVLMGVVPADDEERAINPAAYLVKPFPLHRLEHALTSVLPVPA
jgi:DNA-binding response OmpR family regulator